MHLESTISVYPFGMIMPGRSYDGGSGYRYGYQGSEQDKEISEGSYTTHFRQLDTRIGRWFAVDPKASLLPFESPYASMSDNPLVYNDPQGDHPILLPWLLGLTAAEAAAVGVAAGAAAYMTYELAGMTSQIIVDSWDVQTQTYVQTEITYHHQSLPPDYARRKRKEIDWQNAQEAKKVRDWENTLKNLGEKYSSNSRGDGIQPSGGGSGFGKVLIGSGLAASAAKSFYDNIKSPDELVRENLNTINFASNGVDVLSEAANGPFKIIDVFIKTEYAVTKGDNLTNIAEMFNTTISEIAILNGIEDVDHIEIGQRLIVGQTKETVAIPNDVK